MPQLCKFWARGDCKNGDRCRYDHPPGQGGLRNDNRYAALQPPAHSSGSPFRRPQIDTPIRTAYSITREGVIGDLTTELPQWILSSYGPGIRAPSQLFGGPVREQSFEEVRLRHYEAHALGNPALARDYEDDLLHKAKLQVQNALNDIDGAIEYVLRAENEHPNRIDIGDMSAASASQNFPRRSPNLFAPSTVLPGQPTSTMFGKPAILGQRHNPFGNPQLTVGAQSNGGSNSFEAYRTRPNSFGQPVQQPNSNPFTPQPAGIVSPLTVSSGQSTSNPFGPNPAAQPPSLFAQNQSSQTSQNPFFPKVATPPAANPFMSGGVPSPFSIQTITTNTQHTTQPPADPFQQQRAANLVTGNGFNPFDARSEVNSSSQISTTTPSMTTNNVHQQNRPSSSSGSGPYAKNSSFQHPPLESYASYDRQRLTMFKGKPVVYHEGEAGFKNPDGTWEKIWFPNGAPSYYKDTELPDDAYDGATKAAYLHLREHGSFDGLIMPLLPPKREWCMWNF